MEEYWNHNSAYHRWIIQIAAEHRRKNVLDVGCGEGLLAHRLAPYADAVVGLEPDGPSLARSRTRLAGVPNITLIASDFSSYDPGGMQFDLIVFVATLHHMDLRESLEKARQLTCPGGDVLVVGLSANRSIRDWVISGLLLPFIKLGSLIHREIPNIGIPVAEAQESLSEIRDVVRTVLPGAKIRRGLYYRYLLRWTKPLA